MKNENRFVCLNEASTMMLPVCINAANVTHIMAEDMAGKDGANVYLLGQTKPLFVSGRYAAIVQAIAGGDNVYE